MKKYFFFVFASVLFSFSAKAQKLPIGAFAPDFTLTDINNVSHNLYDYTNQGYTVIIDISTTWCSPCWRFHSSGVLNRLINKYGPTGSVNPGKVMVFLIEADTNTSLAALQGSATTSTQGDWVTGTNYPIINLPNNNLKALYRYSSYPTVYVVCPNRKIINNFKYYGTDTTEAYWMSFVNTCPTKSNGGNAAILGNDKNIITTCPSMSQVLHVPIQNMGSTPLTNAIVKTKINGQTVASTVWNGNLDSYDTAMVAVPNFVGPNEITDVQFAVDAQSDVEPSDDTLTFLDNTFKPSGNMVTMELRLDRQAENKSWTVKNSNNQIVYSSPSYNTADYLTTKYYNFNIPFGECYELEVLDSRGLGLIFAWNDSAFLRVYDGAQNGILKKDFGVDWKISANMSFSNTAPQNVNDVFKDSKVEVYPNPVFNKINYSLDLTAKHDVLIQLLDMNGKVLYAKEVQHIDQYINSINVPHLADGVYYLRLSTDVGNRNIKIVKRR